MTSLLILLPLFGIIALNLPFGRAMRRVAFYFAGALFLTQIFVAIFRQPVNCCKILEKIDAFFRIGHSPDQLSIIMLLCMGIVSLTSLLVSKHTIRDEKDSFKFTNLLLLTSIGMSGVVLVRDIFSLYVFLELTAISSFILIAFKKDVYAIEGAFKYLVLSAIATILMLSSIALLFMSAGDTSFTAIYAALHGTTHGPLAALAVGIFICGLCIKGGLVPFHGWLPDAYMSAPAPASILLAGIVTKTAGIYTLMRVVASGFGFDSPIKNILMVVGAVSILFGALAALGQNDFKRMLAYSSISQVGYIILGFGTGTVLGIAGAVFHLLNHAIFKSLLFVNSAAVESQAGTNDMNKMGGLSSRMPFTGTTSVIGLLSVSGIPPLSGFWSKLVIIIALWQSSHYGYAIIALLASVITLGYLLTMQRKVFFGKIKSGLEQIEEAPYGFVLTACGLALITIGVGIFFPVIFNNFILPVKELLIR